MPPKKNFDDSRYAKVCVLKATGEKLSEHNPDYNITHDTQKTLVLTARDHKDNYLKRRAFFDKEQQIFLREPIEEKPLQGNKFISILPIDIPQNTYLLNTQAYELGGACVLEFKVYPTTMNFGKLEDKQQVKTVNSFYALRVKYQAHEMLIWLGYTLTNRLDEDNFWFPAITLDPYTETNEAKKPEHSFRIRLFTDRGWGRSLVISFLSAADYCNSVQERIKIGKAVNVRMPNLALVNSEEPMLLGVPLPKRNVSEDGHYSSAYQAAIVAEISKILVQLKLPFQLTAEAEASASASASASALSTTTSSHQLPRFEAGRSKRGHSKAAAASMTLPQAFSMDEDMADDESVATTSSATTSEQSDTNALMHLGKRFSNSISKSQGQGVIDEEDDEVVDEEPIQKLPKLDEAPIRLKKEHIQAQMRFQEALKERDSKISRHQDKILNLHKEKTSLNEAIATMREELTGLSEQKERLDRSHQELLENRTRMEQLLEKQAQLLTEREHELRELKGDFRALTTKLASFEAERQTKSNTLSVNQAQLSELQDKLSNTEKENQRLKAEYETAIVEKKKEIVSLHEVIIEFEQETNDLCLKLDAKQKEFDVQTTTLETLQQQVRIRDAELVALTDQMHSRVKSEKSTWEKTLGPLQEQLRQAELRSTTMAQSAEQELRKGEASLAQANRQIQDLSQELLRIKSALSSKAKELSDSETKLRDKELQYSMAIASCKEIEMKHHALSEKYLALQRQHEWEGREKSGIITARDRQIVELQQQHEWEGREKSGIITARDQQIAELQQQHEREGREKSGIIAARDQQIVELQERIQDLETQLAVSQPYVPLTPSQETTNPFGFFHRDDELGISGNSGTVYPEWR